MTNQMAARFKALTRRQKLLLAAVLGVLLYTLIGFLVLPPIVRAVAVRQLHKVLHRDVRIEAVRLNPYTLSATVRNMEVLEPGGQNRLAAFRELYVNLQSVSLFRWAPVIKEFRLDGLYASLELHKDHRWNFSDLLEATSGTEAPAPAEDKKAADPFRFSINNIQLIRSEIRFQDDIRGKTHHITDIDIAVPFLSNLPSRINIFVDPHLYATINGTPFSLHGQVKPFAGSRETDLTLDLQGIDLAAYMPYVPPEADIRIQSGLLDINLALTYQAFEDGRHSFRTAGLIALHNLALADGAGRPMLQLDQLRLELADLEPWEGIVRFQQILLQNPAFTITRLPTERIVRTSQALPMREVFRKINLPPPVVKIAQITLEGARLQIRDLKSAPAAGANQALQDHTMIAIPHFSVARTAIDVDRQAVQVGTVTGREGAFELRRLADGVLNLDILLPPPAAGDAPPAPAGEPWQVDVGQVNLTDYAFRGVNLVPDDPVRVTVDAIDLVVTDFSTRPATRTALDLSCRINETGHLTTRTTLTVQPLSADAHLTLDQIGLAAFYPFIKPYIGVVLADGDLALAGDLILKTDEKGAPSIVYKGQAAVRNFRTLDRRGAQPFVTWQALNASGMDIGVNPTFVTIDEIRLEKPFSRVLIDEKGRLNLAVAAEPESERPATPAPAAATSSGPAASSPPVPITIHALRSNGGDLVFADRSFKPGFQISISAVSAAITGLSSEAAQPAKVDIKGRVAGNAPVSISGQIQPLKGDMYADLTLNLRQLDLTAASPYSGRYVGRTISQGKLTVKTTYLIEHQTLKANHDIQIDQFNFGQKVKSPDDLGLPVDLAVALLKDRRGDIHINLPVSGNMNDPDFSIGGIVLQAFVNLIVKAATSPFTLLGGLFESAHPDHLAFDPGTAKLTPETTAKLDELAKVLYDRPALQVDISGYADPAGDTPALSEILFKRKLQAQKALQLADEGKPSPPLEDIVIAPEEYDDLLQAAYKAETFKKPTNFIGMEKTLPPKEAEALIRQHIEVGTPQLEDLAYARAQAVQDYLLKSGKVDAARVFLVKPENPLAPKVAEGLSPECVILGLK